MSQAAKTTKPQGLWLLALVIALAALGAWYSTHKDRAAAAPGIALADGQAKLIDFGMGVCAQCKRMIPVMLQAERAYKDTLKVYSLDIREPANEQIALGYKMRVIPLILLIDGSGRELWRHEGYISFADLQEQVAKNLEKSRTK